MHLTKYERETIINWNQEEDIASIYTFDKDLQRRLKEFSKKYPDLCWLKSSTREGSKTFEIMKSRLSLRFIAPYSEERRKASSDRAKAQGLHDLGMEGIENGTES